MPAFSARRTVVTSGLISPVPPRLITLRSVTAGDPPLTRWVKAGVLLGGTGGVLAAAIGNPAAGGWFPPCLFNQYTGCYCPGCGTLRAIHALARGDLAGALRLNALMVILLPFMALAVGVWLWPGRPPWKARLETWWRRQYVAVPLAIIIFSFTLLRNLPWPPFAWLAPG